MTGKLTVRIIILHALFVLLIVENVKTQKNNKTFFHRLPIGEYRINIKRIMMCDSMLNNDININWKINKVSSSKIIIDGNLTLKVPLDDNQTFHVNFDQRNMNGEWTNNIMVLNKDKACSTLKLFFKEEYYVPFGWPPNKPCTCPFPVGIYFTKGLPANNFDEALRNMPKVLMYGTYRIRAKIMDKNNKQITCLHWIWDLKRPWESP